MRVLWFDTETTGIDPADSSIFQLACILIENGQFVCERCFYLNPLSDTIKYHEEAGKIHGYSEETIRAFPDEKEQVEIIVTFLHNAVELFKNDGSRTELLVPAGYNVGFDLKHLDALLARNGHSISEFFKPQVADVYEQVKRAGFQKALPYLPDRKLGTVAKHLGVNLDKAHDAMADIRATREVAKRLHLLNVKLV